MRAWQSVVRSVIKSLIDHAFRDLARTSTTIGGWSGRIWRRLRGYGFEAIELFATRSHFDYHDEAAIAALADWLYGDRADAEQRARADYASVRRTATWGDDVTRTPSPITRDAQAAVRETEAALQIARRDSVRRAGGAPRNAGRRRASRATTTARRRSGALEEICRLAEPLGVRVALEVIPNELSTAASLVAMLERRSRRAARRASASTSGTRT